MLCNYMLVMGGNVCGTFSVDLGLQFVMYMDLHNEALTYTVQYMYHKKH